MPKFSDEFSMPIISASSLSTSSIAPCTLTMYQVPSYKVTNNFKIDISSDLLADCILQNTWVFFNHFKKINFYSWAITFYFGFFLLLEKKVLCLLLFPRNIYVYYWNINVCLPLLFIYIICALECSSCPKLPRSYQIILLEGYLGLWLVPTAVHDVFTSGFPFFWI